MAFNQTKDLVSSKVAGAKKPQLPEPMHRSRSIRISMVTREPPDVVVQRT